MSEHTPEYTTYWANLKPFGDKGNSPDLYARESLMERAKNILVEMQMLNFSKASNIFEIGCNSGRNLEFFRRLGYMNLGGLDVNKHAFDYMAKVYPKLYKIMDKRVGAISTIISELTGIYDLVFTIAVLWHVDDPERETMYDWLVRRSKYVIFIEPFNDRRRRIKAGRLLNPVDAVDQLFKRDFKIVKLIEPPFNYHLKNYQMLVMKNGDRSLGT